MSLFRPTYTKNGKKGRSKHWWLEYRDDGRRVRVNLHVTDKRAAELKAAQIIKRAELRSAGVDDPFEEHRVRPLSEHITEFEVALRARGVVKQHADDRIKCLNAFSSSPREPRSSPTSMDLARVDGLVSSARAASVHEA